MLAAAAERTPQTKGIMGMVKKLTPFKKKAGDDDGSGCKRHS